MVKQKIKIAGKEIEIKEIGDIPENITFEKIIDVEKILKKRKITATEIEKEIAKKVGYDEYEIEAWFARKNMIPENIFAKRIKETEKAIYLEYLFRDNVEFKSLQHEIEKCEKYNEKLIPLYKSGNYIYYFRPIKQWFPKSVIKEVK
jgi:hypothetical protein